MTVRSKPNSMYAKLPQCACAGPMLGCRQHSQSVRNGRPLGQKPLGFIMGRIGAISALYKSLVLLQDLS